MQADFRKLEVWKKGILLTESIYKIVSKFPLKEKYSLSNQMTRAAVSISSNIAEGSQRGTTPEFLRFLQIAKGSAAELETQLIISYRLKYIKREEYLKHKSQVRHIIVMLSKLINYHT